MRLRRLFVALLFVMLSLAGVRALAVAERDGVQLMPMTVAQTDGVLLRASRIALGFETQTALAAATRIPQPRISELERGVGAPITVAEADSLSVLFRDRGLRFAPGTYNRWLCQALRAERIRTGRGFQCPARALPNAVAP